MQTVFRRLLVAAFAAAVVCTSFHSGTAQEKKKENDAAKPSERKDGTAKRHLSFVERAKKGGVDVLFIGDSITQGWEGAGKKVWDEKFNKWNAANFGIGGDRTQHVLWRITEGKELVDIDPKVIVMMIGTNNFGNNSAAEVAEGIQAILGEFKKQKPKAKVLLLGVFPRSGKSPKDFKDPMVAAADEQNPKSKATNEIIAKFADDKQVKFLDINSKFLDEKGGLAKSLMPDFLHLSEKGYAIWADAISKTVEEMVK